VKVLKEFFRILNSTFYFIEESLQFIEVFSEKNQPGERSLDPLFMK